MASQIGLTAGTSINYNRPWLHFTLDGVKLYVAKNAFRHSVSWANINSRGAVYGDAEVTVKGLTYKVRLLKGSANDPHIDIFDQGVTNNTLNNRGIHGSEWNRLLYPIRTKGQVHNDPNTLPFGTLANYSDVELGTSASGGYGTFQ